jgi:hypothetical protein
MYTLNQLTIIGFTGNEADIHYTTNGTLVVTLSVATKQSWKDAEGAWRSRTDWHRVMMFGKVAEYARTIAKGSLVMVQAQSARASTKNMAFGIACSSCVPRPSASWIAPNGRSLRPVPKTSMRDSLPAEARPRRASLSGER